jgi:hypothetical protein
MNDPSTLFTRGAPGDADTRGESMVVKHLARQKAALEADALAAMARSLPGTSEAMLRAALEACDWDADAAAAQLREFRAAAAPAGGAKRSAPDRSGSSSSDGSSSDDSGSGRKRSKKDKREKKSKRSKKEKHKSKKESRDKKERKAAPALGAISAAQYGKYGIVKETDMWEKQPEFNAWVTETQQRNPETLQKWEERDMFKDFVECHNTATFPHKKFYSLERWHAKQAARAAKHGGAGGEVRRAACCAWGLLRSHTAAHAPPAGAHGLWQPGGRAQARAGAGARAHAGACRRGAPRGAGASRAGSARTQATAGVSVIEHMRMVGKLDGLREQQTLQKQLQLAAQLGDNEKVRQLQAKLAPDDPRKSAASKNYGAVQQRRGCACARADCASPPGFRPSR